MTVAEFWIAVDRHDAGACWVFNGCRSTREGYKRPCISGKPRYAHRFAFEAVVGPLPAHLQLHHVCRNKTCVNPAHLVPLGVAEHARLIERPTACPRGHAYEPGSTYEYRTSTGGVSRACKVCTLERERQRRIAQARAEGRELRLPHGARTQCPRGHLYTDENTAYKVSGYRRSRYCKECNRERSRANYQRRVAMQTAEASQ